MWPEKANLDAGGGLGAPRRKGTWGALALALMLAVALAPALDVSGAAARPPGLPIATVEVRWGQLQPADGWVAGGSAVPFANRDGVAATLEIEGRGVLRIEPGETIAVVAPETGSWRVAVVGAGPPRVFQVVPESLAAGEPLVIDAPRTSVSQRSGQFDMGDLMRPLAALYIVFAAVVFVHPGRLAQRRQPTHPLAGLSPLPSGVRGRRAPDLTGEPCAGCQTLPCLSVCPAGCFVRAKSDPDLIELRTGRCVSCGLCTAVCPRGAISMKLETGRFALAAN